MEADDFVVTFGRPNHEATVILASARSVEQPIW